MPSTYPWNEPLIDYTECEVSQIYSSLRTWLCQKVLTAKNTSSTPNSAQSCCETVASVRCHGSLVTVYKYLNFTKPAQQPPNLYDFQRLCLLIMRQLKSFKK